MSEEKVVEEGGQDTFEIGGRTYDVKTPKGKKGRKASAHVMTMFSEVGADGVSESHIMELITDSDFEDQHLPAFIGVDKKTLEEDGTIIEILNAVMLTSNKLFEQFGTDEGEEALKNSEEGQQVAEG